MVFLDCRAVVCPTLVAGSCSRKHQLHYSGTGVKDIQACDGHNGMGLGARWMYSAFNVL